MYIHEYGNSTDPKIILLAPMMLSGEDMYNIISPYLKGDYCIIAPDQGGHGKAGKYVNAVEEYRDLKEYLLEKGYTDIKLLYGASLGVAVGYRLFTDGAFNVEHAWFDGVALTGSSAFADNFMRRTFRNRKKLLAETKPEAAPNLVKMYGHDFARMMTANFERITLEDIDAICYACTHYPLTELTSEQQAKLHLEYGSEDIDLKLSKKGIKKYMPEVEPVIREGYPHCGYMAAHTEEYVHEMEAFMNGGHAANGSERKSEIKSAYRSLGKAHGFYDGMMTGSTRLGMFVVKGVWQMNREDMLEYQAGAFEPIPADFKGRILEVPVGTGVLSMPVWKTLPDADITCLDYSEKMMAAAEARAAEMGIGNISFTQGDVGNLPYEDETFDAVVSLNGFHAFPDKEAAYRETFRVLKPGGIFCGCFYVKDSNPHTDKRIRQFYIKTGFFTEPFETVDSLRERLSAMYSEANVTNVQSIAVFQCIK